MSTRGPLQTAVAVGVVLALLYLFPLVLTFVSSTSWQRHLEQIGPMTAGMEIADTIRLHGLPLNPWAGLGVLAVWAIGAFALGAVVLRMRDA